MEWKRSYAREVSSSSFVVLVLKLIKEMAYSYYEKRGFEQLGDVEFDGWPATVLEKRLM